MKVINMEGTAIDFDAAVPFMDDELREGLHAGIAPCSEQECFTAYEQKHAEKFGEMWELSKKNPTY